MAINYSIWYLNVQIQQKKDPKKHQNKQSNIFKVHDKDTKMKLNCHKDKLNSANGLEFESQHVCGTFCSFVFSQVPKT